MRCLDCSLGVPSRRLGGIHERVRLAQIGERLGVLTAVGKRSGQFDSVLNLTDRFAGGSAR
jgi:hypothetical protein